MRRQEDFSELLTEQRNAASAGLDAMPTLEMLRVFHREDLGVAEAVGLELGQIAKAVDASAAALEKGGRLFYAGAGTSGRLGVLDASECPPTFNVPPDLVTAIIAGGDVALRRSVEGAEDDPGAGAVDLLAHGFSRQDVLAGIAASGRTPYVLGAVRKAKDLGALTIGISCVPGSALANEAGIAITPATGPEVITGSTRLKAGTATKLVLNLLSSGVMVRLGHVYSNLMINVQPSNAKLLDRARRIIAAVAGCTEEKAAELLEAGGGRVRTAAVMGKLGVGREEAERRLELAKGRLRQALESV
jgi:N-acetylmuramic acid 6-phosphate etherase